MIRELKRSNDLKEDEMKLEPVLYQRPVKPQAVAPPAPPQAPPRPWVPATPQTPRKSSLYVEPQEVTDGLYGQ